MVTDGGHTDSVWDCVAAYGHKEGVIDVLNHGGGDYVEDLEQFEAA